MRHAQNDDERTARYAQAVEALLTCKNITEAALSLGISRSSLIRWMEAPEFRDLLREAGEHSMRAAWTVLQAAAVEAAELLREGVAKEVPAGRIRAAGLVLDHAERALEMGNLLRRLEDVEARLKQAEGG